MRYIYLREFDNVCAVMLLPRARDGPHSRVGSYCVCTYHGV